MEPIEINSLIKDFIKSGVVNRHRTLFVVNDLKGKQKPSVLWCHKNEKDYSNIRYKKMRNLQKKIKKRSLTIKDDPLELFIASAKINFCHYYDVENILGSTYGMLILQDFEALTPNIIAQTIETVEGGGIILFMINNISSLKKLKTLTMDAHDKYKTESYPNVSGSFNTRFLLSLSSCDRCLVMNDSFKIHPLSSHILNFDVELSKTEAMEKKSPIDIENKIKNDNKQKCLISCCKTFDQAHALQKFMKATHKMLRKTISLTAARGRGKSSALGLATAYAIASNYSQIIVTSPSPDNLKTYFEFVILGLDTLGYDSSEDYKVTRSASGNKVVSEIKVTREFAQTIQYIAPRDIAPSMIFNLLIIDEAAAIPLPVVKNLLSRGLTFMASTVSGYEGTGRSLSLKLIEEQREQTKNVAKDQKLEELTLEECIRYNMEDPVEKWLYGLLCLEAKVEPLARTDFEANSCELYYISKECLFNYQTRSEIFLQKVMSLYVAAHYRNSPNDLQMLIDAPMHHLFCLLPPVDPDDENLPEPLCVIHLSFEGKLSPEYVSSQLRQHKRAFGDLIPWSLNTQFQYKTIKFAGFAGARIVRIATHPDGQRKGFGKRSLHLLGEYFNGNIPYEPLDTSNIISTGSNKNPLGSYNAGPLLYPLNQRAPEKLDYLGVSFGLTNDLMKFWKKSGYIPVYIRQSENMLTGEHTCIMLKSLEISKQDSDWLKDFFTDFERKFISLLGMTCFKKFSVKLAQEIVRNSFSKTLSRQGLDKDSLELFLSASDLERLHRYRQNKVDLDYIQDLVPILARLSFHRQLDAKLSMIQSVILLGLGLQHKEPETVAKELSLDISQLMLVTKQLISTLIATLTKIREGSRNVNSEEPPLKKPKF